jgi:hypothetical protein
MTHWDNLCGERERALAALYETIEGMVEKPDFSANAEISGTQTYYFAAWSQILP